TDSGQINSGQTNSGQAVSGLGHFDGKTHVLPIRVYYEDTDLSGVVYHANYLRYMERARTEFFRLAGVTKMADLDNDEPTAGAIREVPALYHRPARVADPLTVRTELTAISGARLAATKKMGVSSVLTV